MSQGVVGLRPNSPLRASIPARPRWLAAVPHAWLLGGRRLNGCIAKRRICVVADCHAGELRQAPDEIDTSSASPVIRARAAIKRGFVNLHTAPVQSWKSDTMTTAHDAIATLQAAGAGAGLAEAHDLLASVHWAESNLPQTEVHLGQALQHARTAGDEQAESRFRAWLATLSQSRSTFPDLGLRTTLASSTQISGMVEMLAGDPVAAEAEFRRGDEIFTEMGERLYRTTSAPLLARALFEQGRLDEADRYVTRAAEIAGDDEASRSEWGAVRARLLSTAGEHEQAARLAQEVVDITAASGEPQQHGDALFDLGAVLHVAGGKEGARTALVAAEDVYRAKGVVPALDTVARARAELGD